MIDEVIRTYADLVVLFKRIRKQPYPFHVKVIDKQTRSDQQNDLMWRWARDVSSQTGYTPEEVQARWKGKFGIPLLSEASEKHRKLFLRIPWKEGSEEEIMENLEALNITRVMTIAQMTQFLDKVWKFHTSVGHELTNPEDVKW